MTMHDFAELHYYSMGNTLKKLGRMEEALASYQRALQIKPDFAEALNNMGNTLKDLGRLDEALVCYQRLIRLTPENLAVQHIIASITGNNTDCAPAQYVENLFDGYADKFDTHLRQALKYETPEKIVALVTRHATSAAKKWNVLDLGCGTGLVGSEIAPFARQLVGVDLSAGMLGKARARNLYQRLEHMDLLEMMRAEKDSSYDVIVAADVFIYLGKLDEIICEIKRLLSPGGFFAFSIEVLEALPDEETGRGAQREYQLENTGRYTHAVGYITRLAAANGFLPQEMAAIQLRMEQEKPVNGHLVLWEN
jgi:predicted TPR repeat methyltransferase